METEERIILDGEKLLDAREGHSYLAERLSLPDYYGRNLDALYDCLTAICHPTQIIVETPEDSEKRQSDCLGRFRKVFNKASGANPYLRVVEKEKRMRRGQS